MRKTVTIVFSDLKGSTALGETLDDEAMHEVKEHSLPVLRRQRSGRRAACAAWGR